MTPSPAQSEQLAKSLAAHIEGEVRFASYDRALYSTDASMYQLQPAGVVIPRTPTDVARTVRLAAEYGVPVVARGAGTSLSGQTVGRGLVLDFSKYLNRIVEIDPDARTARVQPGVVLDQLNAAAAAYRLQFGPDVATSSRANLGGMIGNNSAGARSIRHGKTVDHVVSLDVVLADGSQATLAACTPDQVAERQRHGGLEGQTYRRVPEIIAANREQIIERFPPLLRRVSGYNLDEFVAECRKRMPLAPSARMVRQADAERAPGADFNLAKLVVGAEGSLACVTEALVHLVPLPAERGVLVLEFDSLAAAVDTVGTILEYEPSAVELFDRAILQLAARSLEYRNYLDFVVGQPASLILAEFSGDTADEVAAAVAQMVETLAGRPGLSHHLAALDPQTCDHIWACRKAALPLLLGVAGRRKPIAFVEDTAVPPPRLPEFVARFRDVFARAGTEGTFYGHASVGCLHVRPLLDTTDGDDLRRMEQILDEVAALVQEFGGAMSGEHGDGLARSFLNERMFGPEVYRAFCDVKAAFDPQDVLNPGKVVHGPSPTRDLRAPPGRRTLEVDTAFDYSRQGGFVQAVELCNGNALCRKMRGGTMCPSYMATADEEHTTRGRANALRLVLSGALPPAEMTGRRLYETFDLCLQCKGCKAECPSNVDVAKLKAEFLHQYQQVNGATLGARAMAHVAGFNRLGSTLAPLSNWAARAPGAAWLNERLFGIDRRRPLPTFHRRHFRRWFRDHPRQPAGQSRGKVVLLDDCLTTFCEPRVNQAAVRVLESLGYEVQLAALECCGRALISKGFLAAAKRLAADNVARLVPFVEQGLDVVGCEPSCVLTLADDYLDLVPGPAAERLAARVRLIDGYVLAAGDALPLAARSGSALLHGHCHQKALVGDGDSQRLLERIAGLEVVRVDAGCCGMAGSFGYEHYELSMKIGGRVLFPAIEAAPEATIVAPGFSCRHQIEHGTGRAARHPIELVADQLRR